MSDPRSAITRAVHAPPAQPPLASPAPRQDMPGAPEVRLIGKPHGRLRCVNLALTAIARAHLYSRAADDEVTLGEALMDCLYETPDAFTVNRRPGRRPTMRHGRATQPVHVLLTAAEAGQLAARAENAGRSVSDLASRILEASADNDHPACRPPVARS